MDDDDDDDDNNDDDGDDDDDDDDGDDGDGTLLRCRLLDRCVCALSLIYEKENVQ